MIDGLIDTGVSKASHVIADVQEIERQTVDLQSVLSRQESILKEFLVYCQFENDMEQVLHTYWNKCSTYCEQAQQHDL